MELSEDQKTIIKDLIGALKRQFHSGKPMIPARILDIAEWLQRLLEDAERENVKEWFTKDMGGRAPVPVTDARHPAYQVPRDAFIPPEFIILTDEAGKPIPIRVGALAYAQAFERYKPNTMKSESESLTRLWFSESHSLIVKETPAEILDKIESRAGTQR